MPTVELEIVGSVARITLNRPDKLNAIDAGMLDQLESAPETTDASDDILEKEGLKSALNWRARQAGDAT